MRTRLKTLYKVPWNTYWFDWSYAPSYILSLTSWRGLAHCNAALRLFKYFFLIRNRTHQTRCYQIQGGGELRWPTPTKKCRNSKGNDKQDFIKWSSSDWQKYFRMATNVSPIQLHSKTYRPLQTLFITRRAGMRGCTWWLNLSPNDNCKISFLTLLQLGQSERHAFKLITRRKTSGMRSALPSVGCWDRRNRLEVA